MRCLAAVVVVLMAGGGNRLSCASCSAWEAKKEVTGEKSVFRVEGSPWKITTDLDANVTIENGAKKTSCAAKLESVMKAYFGPGDRIYLRSQEVGSDDLYTFSGTTCKEARGVRHLSVSSEAKNKQVLQALGICDAK